MNIRYMFIGFGTGCLFVIMLQSISISSHLDMIAWHLNRVSLKMQSIEGNLDRINDTIKFKRMTHE